MARYPSSKEAVCKTVIHGCKSHPGLLVKELSMRRSKFDRDSKKLYFAEVLELEDSMDLKSIGGYLRAGVSPALGTKNRAHKLYVLGFI